MNIKVILVILALVLFLGGLTIFFNFIVSDEEMAPDKFLAFGLGLGFNLTFQQEDY